MKVFGLDIVSGNVPTLIHKDVKNRNNPDVWSWVPHNPEKIKNLKEEVDKERESVNYAVITNYTPSDEKQNIALIFSIGNLSFGVINNLISRNIPFYYIKFSQLAAIGELNIELTNDSISSLINLGGNLLDLNDIKVVLYCEPPFPFPLFDNEKLPKTKGRHQFLFKKRWAQFLRELHLLLNNDVHWIPGNPYIGSQAWQNKIGELKMAKSFGMKIPQTIFTNSLERVLKFAGADTLLMREFSTPPYSFPPILIEDIKKIDFKNLSRSPVCFQKYIDKKFEYRVVIIGNKVIPVRIYSQDSELSKVDWRVYDDANVKWELCSLPSEIEITLLKIAKELNLNWCSIDLIENLEGEFYYLETNRPGAHYWLDLFVGLDITKEIVCLIEKFIYE